jgi:DNA polymerase III gamma/tau subunit
LLATSAAELGGGIDAELARRMLGLSHDDRAIALLNALADRDVAAGLRTIGAAVDAGLEMRTFGRQVLGLLRTLLLVRAGAHPPETDDTARALAERFELPELLRINRHFADQDLAIRNGGFPQLPLELAVVASILGQEPAVVAAQPPAVPEHAPSRSRPVLMDAAHAEQRPERMPDRRREPAREREPAQPPPSPSPAMREPTPLRRAPAPAAASDSAGLARITANWERVRTEVKSMDRKVEALLASTDPGAYDGRQLTLVSAYPFHASKLNEPKSRTLVEQALERILGEPVSIAVVVKDEFAPPTARSNGGAQRAEAPTRQTPQPRPEPTAEAAVEPYALAQSAPESHDDAMVRTAKALFDAEEVEPDELP